MDMFGTVVKFLVAFVFTLVFLIGFLSVCNYQVQIVQGQGMQLVSSAIAQGSYE